MMDGAMSVVFCHSIFRISVFSISVFRICVQRVVPLAVFYRALALMRYRFSVKIYPCPASDAAFFVDQNFALSGVIGLADNALKFHPLHQ